MRGLIDNIVRGLGYFTSADVAARVRAAEEAVSQQHSLPDSEVYDSTENEPTEPEAMPSDYIRYFISYNFTASYGRSGFGCIEIGRAQTIQSQEDIATIVGVIAGKLEGRGLQNPGVVILNWQPFEPPRQDDGSRETVDADMPSTMVLRLVA